MNFIIIAPSRDHFNGQSILDAGYFYAPYIPLINIPTFDMSSDFKRWQEEDLQ